MSLRDLDDLTEKMKADLVQRKKEQASWEIQMRIAFTLLVIFGTAALVVQFIVAIR